MTVENSAPATNAKKLHCPNCKSYNFTITTESSVDAALTTGNRIKSTTVSNTHRSYWVCSDCGTKFRNIQSLEEEIAKSKKSPIWAAVFAVIAFIFFAWMLIMMIAAPFLAILLAIPTFIAFIATAVCVVFIFVYMNNTKKLQKELEYLKENCFN